MAVFLPITIEAQDEARAKATPSTIPFYDKNGSPIYEFSLEFIYGLYYATNSEFSSEEYPEHLCYVIGDSGETRGSLEVVAILSKYKAEKYYQAGTVINKKVIRKMTKELIRNLPREEALEVLMELMELSTRAFSESGLSLKFSDFVELDRSILQECKTPLQYEVEEGRLIKEFEAKASPDNSLLSIVKSGARGNYTQIKQLVISKGYLVDSNGNYLPPVYHSLYDGLSLEEFITTVSASRRGMVSKSLSTAETGYSFYKIAKSMRDLEITKEDCEAERGLSVPLADSLDRYLAVGVDEFPRDTLMTEEVIKTLEHRGVTEVEIRSPITCCCETGTCIKCWGKDVSHDKPIEVGAKVGVITGATISEIMTQAMLKNFHTAGVIHSKAAVIENPDLEHMERVDKFYKIPVKDSNLIYLLPEDIVTITDKARAESPRDGAEDVVHPRSEAGGRGCQSAREVKYFLSNDDVRVKFEQLKSILNANTGDALIAPCSGVLSLDEIVNKISWDGGDNSELSPKPVRLQYYQVRITGEDGKVTELKVPYHNHLLVPLGTEVKQGQILSSGFINYQQLLDLTDRDTVARQMVNDLLEIYHSQGSDLRPVYLELVVKHILGLAPSELGGAAEGDDEADKPRLQSIMDQGHDRSYLQWTSLGHINKAYPYILDRLNDIGNTNAERIALGTYSG